MSPTEARVRPATAPAASSRTEPATAERPSPSVPARITPRGFEVLHLLNEILATSLAVDPELRGPADGGTI